MARLANKDNECYFVYRTKRNHDFDIDSQRRKLLQNEKSYWLPHRDYKGIQGFLQYKHVLNTGFQRGNMATSVECSTVYRLERRKAMKAYPAGEEHEYGLCYNFQNYNHFHVSSCLNVRNHINIFLRIAIWRLHLTSVEIRKKVYLISRGRTRKVRGELTDIQNSLFPLGPVIKCYYYMACVCTRYNARSDWLSEAKR